MSSTTRSGSRARSASQAARAVGEGLHPVTLALEGEPHRFADRLLVVHDGDQPLLPRRHDSQHADRRSTGRQGNSPPHCRHNSPRTFPGRVAARRHVGSLATSREHGLHLNPSHSWRCVMRFGLVRWLVAILATVGASSALAQEAPPRVTHGSLLVHPRRRRAGRGARRPDRRPDPSHRSDRAGGGHPGFLNPTAGWLEGVYVFPLPEGRRRRRHAPPGRGAGDRRPDPGARGGAPDVPAGAAVGQEGVLLEQERPNVF